MRSKATCHPDHELVGKGLCRKCYGAAYFQRGKLTKQWWGYHLRNRYNLSPKQFGGMLAEQGGGCILCGKVGKLEIDHNHKTRRVRGLVCKWCNGRLGWLENNWELIMKYLVTAEEVATHTVVVEAEDEDQAAEMYMSGEFVEDRGETFDEDSGLVLSVERLDDEDDEVA